jgi:tetratricopeptide (TPR) repeat protein
MMPDRAPQGGPPGTGDIGVTAQENLRVRLRSCPDTDGIPKWRNALANPLWLFFSILTLLPLLGKIVHADSSLSRPYPGDPGMPPHPATMLVASFEQFLGDQDIEVFRRNVTARYTEATLCRVTHSHEIRARRAAVLALGFNGGFGANATVGRLLKDRDPTVRSLAANALWAIWSRADSPENNAALEQVQTLIELGRHREAIRRATQLIEVAPNFAEAYNQRAIAHYQTGHLNESVSDCRRVLELNSYHFGALSGMGQCHLRLGQRREAIRTFRRALELQPYSDGLRETVAELEAAGD